MEGERLQTLEKYTDLHLCGCGCIRCGPLDAYGTAIGGAYCLFCAAEGKGVVRRSGGETALEENHGLLVEPNVEFSLAADEFDPWAIFWLAFDGASAPACLRALGIGEEPFACDGPALSRLAEEAQRLDVPGMEGEFLLQSMLYRVLACFAHGAPEQPGQAVGENQHVRRAAEYIRTHYADGITVADVAKYVALNRSYMTTLFQRALGLSPQEYLARYRLTRAEELLTHSDATVATVAYSCGYQDPQVFSKAFRQRYGQTPAKYRAAAGKSGE